MLHGTSGSSKLFFFVCLKYNLNFIHATPDCDATWWKFESFYQKQVHKLIAIDTRVDAGEIKH